MLIEEALKTLITTDSRFISVIGANLYPLIIPEDAKLPAIAFQEITSKFSIRHDGPGDLVTTQIQFTIEGDSYRSAKIAAKTVRSIIDGYRGIVDGIKIGGIFCENEYDGYSENSELRTVRQDYQIEYSEEV
jgi:hypothetical protein